MADRNCYAVKCHSPEHCVTAPARKNKWHPSVVFVKRISQSNKNYGSHSAHALSEQNGALKDNAHKEASAVHKDVEIQVGQSKDDKESQTTHAQNKPSGISQEHTLKKTSAVQKSDNFQVDKSKVKEGNTAETQDKHSKTSKKHVKKEKTAFKKGVKNSKIPERGGIVSSLAIPVQGKPAVVRLDEEEMNSKRKTRPLSKRKVSCSKTKPSYTSDS